MYEKSLTKADFWSKNQKDMSDDGRPFIGQKGHYSENKEIIHFYVWLKVKLPSMLQIRLGFMVMDSIGKNGLIIHSSNARHLLGKRLLCFV